jgi:hypothetical protein
VQVTPFRVKVMVKLARVQVVTGTLVTLAIQN